MRSRLVRRLRRLLADTYTDLRGHDVPLAAAGLTFYASVALVPLLLVALWLSALVLGGAQIRDFGETLANIVGSRHGLDRGVRQLTQAGTSARVVALVAAAMISTLYGEGLTRALARLAPSDAPRQDAPDAPTGAPPPHRRIGVLRGRLAAPLLVTASGVLIGGGLVIMAWLSSALGSSGKATVLGVYLAFLVCWAGATANVVLCYRVFGPQRLRLGPMLWGAAGAGSWIAGSALGFLLVLSLPTPLGRPFADSDALGTAALLAFWLYFCHIAVLLGYAVAVRLTAGPRAIALRRRDPRRPPSDGQPGNQARLALRG